MEDYTKGNGGECLSLEQILIMPNGVRRPAITELALRPIAQLEKAADQKARFRELVQQPE